MPLKFALISYPTAHIFRRISELSLPETLTPHQMRRPHFSINLPFKFRTTSRFLQPLLRAFASRDRTLKLGRPATCNRTYVLPNPSQISRRLSKWIGYYLESFGIALFPSPGEWIGNNSALRSLLIHRRNTSSPPQSLLILLRRPHRLLPLLRVQPSLGELGACWSLGLLRLSPVPLARLLMQPTVRSFFLFHSVVFLSKFK